MRELHGDGPECSNAHAKGRLVPGDWGDLKTAATGFHSWLWRNRGCRNFTIALKLRGDYSEVKRTY